MIVAVNHSSSWNHQHKSASVTKLSKFPSSFERVTSAASFYLESVIHDRIQVMKCLFSFCDNQTAACWNRPTHSNERRRLVNKSINRERSFWSAWQFANANEFGQLLCFFLSLEGFISQPIFINFHLQQLFNLRP